MRNGKVEHHAVQGIIIPACGREYLFQPVKQFFKCSVNPLLVRILSIIIYRDVPRFTPYIRYSISPSKPMRSVICFNSPMGFSFLFNYIILRRRYAVNAVSAVILTL